MDEAEGGTKTVWNSNINTEIQEVIYLVVRPKRPQERANNGVEACGEPPTSSPGPWRIAAALTW